VRVMVLLPGMVRSEFHGEQGLPAHLPVMDAADVAAAALAGLALGEVVCVPGLEDIGLFEELRDLQQAILSEVTRCRSRPGTAAVPEQMGSRGARARDDPQPRARSRSARRGSELP